MVLREGEVIDSGNFRLTKKITDGSMIFRLMQTEKSIFLRHKMYPVAFLQNQQFRTIKNYLEAGWFWETEDLREQKINNNNYKYKKNEKS